jgi:hypothetical protein
MKRYKRHRDYGFFDQDIRLSKLSQLGDPLEKLNSGVDFEIFRQKLVQQSHQGLHKQITITNEEFEDVEEDFSPGLFFLGHF